MSSGEGFTAGALRYNPTDAIPWIPASTSRVPLMAVVAIAAVFTRKRVSNVSQQDRL
jgi:hypothetical protein